MSDISPLPTPSSRPVSISSIVTVDWCYIPAFSFRQTHRRAKQFPPFTCIEGIRYHSHTLGHLRKRKPRTQHYTTTFWGSIRTCGEPPSATPCNHCQDQAGGIEMLPHAVCASLSTVQTECRVPITNDACRLALIVVSMVMYKWLDLYKEKASSFHHGTSHRYSHNGREWVLSRSSVKLQERSDDTPGSWRGGRSSTQQTKGRHSRGSHPHKQHTRRIQ